MSCRLRSRPRRPAAPCGCCDPRSSERSLPHSLGRRSLAGRFDLAGADLSVQPRDVTLHVLDPARVVQLAGGQLEPQVEQLDTNVLELLLKIRLGHLSDLCLLYTSPSPRD